MSCPETRERFSDLTEGAVTPAERATLNAHLETCADCRRELERFEQTLSLLGQIESPRAPLGFVDRVLARARPVPWYRRLGARLGWLWPVRVPIEAAAVVLLATVAVYVFERTPELQRATVQESPRPMLEQRQAPARDDTLPRDTAPAGPAPAAPSAVPELLSRREQEPVAATSAVPQREASSESPPPAAPAIPPTVLSAPPGSMDATKQPEVAEGVRPARPSQPAYSPALRDPTPLPKRGDPTEGRLGTLGAARPAAPSAARVLPGPTLTGRLAVRDRQAAERQVGELLLRVGGMEIARREEPGVTLLDVVVRNSAYGEFARALALLGSWLPDTQPASLPAEVVVTLRITD